MADHSRPDSVRLDAVPSSAIEPIADATPASFLTPDKTVLAERCREAGDACLAENGIEQALAHYDQALRLGMKRQALSFKRWFCFMVLGEFERAWQETDYTEGIRRASGAPQSLLPRHEQQVWNGAALEGKRVLVRCYHGLGDTIHFIRYIPLLKQIAPSITVQCQPSLAALIASVPGMDRMILLDDPAPEPPFDFDIELMELPYALRTTLETIPADVPYLSVPGELIASRRAALAARGLAVGLAWSSGDWNPERTMPLAELEPLGRIPGLQLFSLQRGPAKEEIASGAESIRIVPADTESVLETAATILSLDLIVSVDTMVAHLAGALGKPVWTMLPFCADWRWMVGRADSPWYATMRLFRQRSRGDWSSVVEQVARELSLLARK